ncbi:5474_t:CDS:1 [Funneliformis caledonium]|uniref:5474_t:CDS:1 n=1 Tax=Funneliformis caledonium TaxID=1117310 RepID=A0A9N9F1H2_9GLOM|nr:5474_t:CDS:1 [Funneliformis caledonium]
MWALEIPTQISFPLYMSLLSIWLLTFIGLSMIAPTTKQRYITLMIISLTFILIPLKYGKHFNCIYHLPIPVTIFGCFFKMLIWLKKCKQKIKETPPFFLTLFFWRKDYTGSTKSNKNSMTKEKLKSYLIQKSIKLFFRFLFHETCLYFLETFPPTIPDRSYPLRIIDYLLLNKNTFIATPYTLFYCYVYAGFLAHNMDYAYNRFLVIIALIWYIQKNSSDKNSSTNSKVEFINQYLITLLFDTPSLFNQPYLSISPSDLWGRRWHQILRECFFELGYLPIRSLFLKYQVLGHDMGLIASFTCSGIFHEYLLTVLLGRSTGEHFTFFVFHGVMVIVWDIIWLPISKYIKYFIDKRLTDFLVWNCILIFSTPWFIEPYIRSNHFHCISHLLCNNR